MNKIIAIFLFLNTVGVFSQSASYQSDFVRLDATDFVVNSYFNNTMGNCFDLQYRFESEQNDTLFLELIFETRGGSFAVPCSRVDTLQVSGMFTDHSYINLSTGRVTFNQTDPNIGDTLWSLYDSTFTSELSISFLTQDILLNESFDGLCLSVDGIDLEKLTLLDLNGRNIASVLGNELYIADLPEELYIILIFTHSGEVYRKKWYKF